MEFVWSNVTMANNPIFQKMVNSYTLSSINYVKMVYTIFLMLEIVMFIFHEAGKFRGVILIIHSETVKTQLAPPRTLLSALCLVKAEEFLVFA